MTKSTDWLRAANGRIYGAARRYPALMAWFAYVLLIVAFHGIFSVFFPIDGYRLGHDYAGLFPNWLDGRYWFANNGLEPPWFSPSFCAGQPFFADPQSAYYALPQIIALLSNPLKAAYLSLLASASLMYWGGYLLMRRVFHTSLAAACLVGGLLMFNGFLPHRMIAGHTSFHAFSLAPCVALLLLLHFGSRWGALSAAIGAGVLLAYWVQSGLGTLLVPASMAVLLIALIAAMRGGSVKSFVQRAAVAAIVSLGLSASKLVAAVSLMGQFPRDFYPLPGAASVGDALILLFSCLFLPSQAAFQIGMPRLVNVMGEYAPHEWAYGFGIATAMLAAVLVYSLARNRLIRIPRGYRQWALLLVMLFTLTWPLAFSTWQTDWNAFLKSLPLLRSTSFPIRWFIVYIPFTAVCLGLMLESQARGRAKTFAVLACLAGTVILSAIEPRSFYQRQGYDMRPITAAFNDTSGHSGAAQISKLGVETGFSVGAETYLIGGNDTLAAGVSQIFCYNPLFGYRLEKFSAEGLESGDVLKETNGYLNLKNPACYVFPKENDCHPGDRFRADQIDLAKAFVAYRPFPFKVSATQTAANIVTEVTLVLVLGWIVVLIVGYAAARYRVGKETTRGSSD